MDKTNNIYLGSQEVVHCCSCIYSLLMTRNWVSHANMLAMCMDKPLNTYDNVKLSALDKKLEISYYRTIKKNLKRVFNAIIDVCPNSIECNGKKKGVAYRYIGEKENPLSEFKNTAALEAMKAYWQFCQDSVGLLPTSWLDYFFKNTRDLFEMKNRRNRGQQYIQSSVDRKLQNIDLLPQLYQHIIRKEVIRLSYQPFDKPIMVRVVHPQYLREYNGRWHLLGYEDGAMYDPAVLAIDRIVANSIEQETCVTYKSRSSEYYSKYFQNIVGLTHNVKGTLKRICIRAYGKTMFGLTETKPIHSTQFTSKPYGKYENGEYGEFEVCVEPNNEFYGVILQKGDGLEIISPQDVREEMERRVSSLSKRYNIGSN